MRKSHLTGEQCDQTLEKKVNQISQKVATTVVT